MSQVKVKTISEFANELPYPIPEWQKALLSVLESGGEIVPYSGRKTGCFIVVNRKSAQEVQQEQCKGKTIMEMLEK